MDLYRGSRVRSPPVPVVLSVYQRGSLLDGLAMYSSCLRGSSMIMKSKVKGKRSIAVRKKPHRYGNSCAIWDHTVLPATRQR